jgi:hypothetical protein
VFSEPVHDELRLPRRPGCLEAVLAAQCYIITSEGNGDVNRRTGRPQ